MRMKCYNACEFKYPFKWPLTKESGMEIIGFVLFGVGFLGLIIIRRQEKEYNASEFLQKLFGLSCAVYIIGIVILAYTGYKSL